MNTLPSELSRVVVSTDQIQSRVKELADQISADFAGGEPLYHRNPERCLHIPGRSYAEPGCTPHGRLHGTLQLWENDHFGCSPHIDGPARADRR